MLLYRFPLSALFCLLVPILGGVACRSAEASKGRPKTLSVYAASSLTEAFEALEEAFEREHPGVDVQLTFAGSQVLRLQLEQGAQADVFASANRAHMRSLAQAGVVAEGPSFARNELVVIVPPDNPADIGAFSDLFRAQRLVLGNDNVPIGIYARTVIERAAARYGNDFSLAVYGHVVSVESNVRLLRAKVELGEADAALVYRTDARGSDRVRVIPIPAEFNVQARYPIGRLVRTAQPDLSERFIAFVCGPSGQRILQAHGFSKQVP